MKKLFCILGKSASGKDSLTSSVAKELNLSTATSFTTRPMRCNEVEGREYYFIDDMSFWDLHGCNLLAEYTTYKIADGSIWYYGLTKEELEKNEFVIVVVNPHGLSQLEKIYGDKIVSILIDCDGITRLLRTIKRDKNTNPKEMCRRYLADEEMFKDLVCDYIIYNEEELHKTVKKMKDIIKEEIKNEKSRV